MRKFRCFFLKGDKNICVTKRFKKAKIEVPSIVKSIKQYVNLDLKEIVSNGFLAFFDSSLIGEAPQKSLPKSANGKS